MNLTIRIPGRIDSDLRPNCHKHWRVKHRAQQTAKSLGKYHAATLADDDGSGVAFRYDVTIGMAKRQNVMDDDNAVACLKHYIDGIADGLAMPDDKHLRLGTVEQVRDPTGVGYIEFRLTDLTSEEGVA